MITLRRILSLWFLPRSQERGIAFAERAIRAILPFLALIVVVSYAEVVARGLGDRWFVVGPWIDLPVLGFCFVMSALSLSTGHVNRSGAFLSIIILHALTVSLLGSGYWDGSNVAIALTVMLVLALYLPNRLLIVFTALIPLSFLLVGLLEQSQGVVPPDIPGLTEETPWTIFLRSSITLGFGLVMVLILKQEYTRRVSEVQDLVSTLEQRVSDRTQDLEAARAETESLYQEQIKVSEQLRAVDQMKSQFLASMSHELRTPLNAVLNFTEFVALGMMGPVNEKQVETLNKSLDSARHLLALINDVLDMTKIESGMMKLFVEDDVDVRKELDAVVDTAHTMLKDRPVAVLTDIDSQLPLLSVDRRRIRQVLLNLVSNAAKFTEEGSITISVKQRSGELLFAVIDTGPGIAEKDHTIIFEPFKQAEHGIRHANGTGLGLPITKRLVEAHHGRLWLESQPGEGAAFYFTLPVRTDMGVALIPA